MNYGDISFCEAESTSSNAQHRAADKGSSASKNLRHSKCVDLEDGTRPLFVCFNVVLAFGFVWFGFVLKRRHS